jgi:hypothetical protein
MMVTVRGDDGGPKLFPLNTMLVPPLVGPLWGRLTLKLGA